MKEKGIMKKYALLYIGCELVKILG